ncbi:MAG: DsbE family thiol:disulfide interchange protein [Hyphomicrobium sp.]
MAEAAKPNLIRLLPVAIFVVVAGLFAIALQTGDPSKLPSMLIGKPAPVSTFPPVDGLIADSKQVPGFSTADLAKGKVTIVNFWASWCTSCVEEHPLLARLKTASGVELFGVAQKDDPAASRRFLGRYGNPFSVVGTDKSGRSSIDWGVYGMPETFIVNGRGEIVYKHIGPISEESIQSKILPAIAAAKGEKPVAAQ